MDIEEEMNKFEQGFAYKPPKKNSEWISVKDKMPPEDGYYLFYLEDGKQCIGNYVDDCDSWKSGGWQECYYFGGQNPIHFPQSKSQQRSSILVTHWMPLPKPPEHINEGEKNE